MIENLNERNDDEELNELDELASEPTTANWYARISSAARSEDVTGVAEQLAELREHAAAAGYEVVVEYVEDGSAEAEGEAEG